MNLVGLVLFLFAFLLPFINATPYVISIGTSAMIYIMLAMGLNIVVGYAGLLDLGYYAFFAVGALLSRMLITRLRYSVNSFSASAASPFRNARQNRSRREVSCPAYSRNHS